MRRRATGGDVDETKLADRRVETWTTDEERARLSALCRAAHTVDELVDTITAELGPAAATGAAYLPTLWPDGLDVVVRSTCARWAVRYLSEHRRGEAVERWAAGNRLDVVDTRQAFAANQ